MSDTLKEVLDETGFSSETDFFKLISGVKLTATGALKLFNDWQDNDGTKAGLLAAFPYLTEVENE